MVVLLGGSGHGSTRDAGGASSVVHCAPHLNTEVNWQFYSLFGRLYLEWSYKGIVKTTTDHTQYLALKWLNPLNLYEVKCWSCKTGLGATEFSYFWIFSICDLTSPMMPLLFPRSNMGALSGSSSSHHLKISVHTIHDNFFDSFLYISQILLLW